MKYHKEEVLSSYYRFSNEGKSGNDLMLLAHFLIFDNRNSNFYSGAGGRVCFNIEEVNGVN